MRWWKWARRVRRVKEGPTAESTEAVAPHLRAGEFVAVGPVEHPKWVFLGCPCRCGEVLWVNLMPGQARRWTLERGPDGAATLAPSLDATTCGSHFWIRRGAVIWV